MTSDETRGPVRLKASPAVARIVAADAPRELQSAAARGTLPLPGRDLVTALLILAHGPEPNVKAPAQQTLRHLPAAVLVPVVETESFPPRLIDALVKLRPDDVPLVRSLLAKGGLGETTLLHLAACGSGKVLNALAEDASLLERPELRAALCRNPQAEPALRARLSGEVPAPPEPSAGETTGEEVEEEPEGGGEETEEAGEEPEEAGEGPEEEVNASKYQQSLEMVVAEKIKMALTGDKEWRTIFLRDANKLVSSAVLKNPRITDGEVLTVAKNRSTGDELIRLITLNREWIKNYEIRRALVMHPRTPLPKALRYMSTLSDRDMKSLAKSRGVSAVIVNNARRILMAKQKGK